MSDIPECTMCNHADSMCIRGMPSCYYERKPKMNKDQELVEKLKPCPFCGSDAVLRKNVPVHVRCSNPECDIHSAWIRYNQWNCRQHDMQMAIEADEALT